MDTITDWLLQLIMIGVLSNKKQCVTCSGQGERKSNSRKGQIRQLREEGPLFGDDKLNVPSLKNCALGDLFCISLPSVNLMDWKVDNIFTEERFKCLVDNWIAIMPLENRMTIHFDRVSPHD